MAKKFYIKERENPQFKKPYYQALGQITKKEAKKHENTVYGWNNVRSYETEDEYNKALDKLKADGFRVF